jgi:hypothetical protein
MKWLDSENFISLEPRAGHTPIITMLDPRGTEKPYTPRAAGRYLGVPVEFWTKGWILDLSPLAIALLFVLLELLGGEDSPRYVTRIRRDQYGLSSDTWTRATKELVAANLLTVGRVPQGSEYDYRRLRNTYWVNEDVLTGPRT